MKDAMAYRMASWNGLESNSVRGPTVELLSRKQNIIDSAQLSRQPDKVLGAGAGRGVW